jgi:hypothetical protein
MTTKIATTNIQDTALTTLLGPKVTTIVYPGTETATDTAGGETINLTGNGFQSGCSVLVASTSASVVTFISSTQISFVAPAQSAGTYVIYVINPDGGTAISIPGISYSGTPNWTTTAGSLGTAYEAGSISATLTATGDAPITYVLATGTLPTGSSLASNGTLSGTAPATASATTYNFTITAKDAQNQTTNRAFSLTINPDVVTWSTPASLATYNVFTNTAIANVTMSATSASGGSITYTADTLPTGLSITGANIAGTPTVVASTTTVLTATATSTRTATRTINWVVSVANDTFWKNTTLLLNGETTVTPFINDASTNSLGLTINGDTKPTLFSPYQGDGYYSNYFDGVGDYLSLASNSAFDLASGDFTIEFWMNTTASQNSDARIIGNWNNDGWAANKWSVHINHSSPSTPNQVAFWVYNANSGSQLLLSTTTVNGIGWVHVAVVRSGTSWALFINGTRQATATSSSAMSSGACPIQIGGTSSAGEVVTGYISNIRMVKGTAVYSPASTTISVPTTPLTAIANTSLLTCQSNRLIDISTNAFAITKNGDVSVSPAIPFTQNASYSTYGSAYFDGTGDYLTAPSVADPTGDFTIEFWWYPTSLGTFMELFTKGVGIQIYYQSPNMVAAISATNSGTYYISGVSFGAPTISSWNHIAVVRNGNAYTGYLNGTSTSLGTSSSSPNTGGSNFYIGAYQTPNYYTFGYLSNVRYVVGTAIYTSSFTPPTSPLTAITNTQLLTLQYNGGANNYGIIDNSNFNNIITRFGNTSQGTFSPYSQTGWSNYFDGSSYLALPDTGTMSLGTGNFTFEFWVNPITDIPAYTKLLTGGASGTFTIETQNSDNKLWVTNFAGTILGSTTALTINTWNHFAAVRNSGTLTLYVNGVASGTVSDSTNFSNTIYIGGRPSTQYFTGYMSNIRFVKGTAIYTSAFTPPAAPLTPITNTILLTSQSNRFIDNGPNNFALTVTGTPSVQAFGPVGSISEATPTSYSTYFNGSTDYLSITSNAAFAFGTGDFTIEFWTYINNTNRQDFIDIDNGGGYRLLIMYYSNALGYWPANSLQITGPSLTINTWYHIAVVRISGSSKMYVNGTQVGSTYTDSTNYLAQPAYFGHDHAGSTYVTGYMSNLRIVKGVGVYTGNFTTPTNPLASTQSSGTNIAAISGTSTSLLTCQSATIVDNSSNALTITASGLPKLYKYNPFGYTAQSATSYTPSIHGGSMYCLNTSSYVSTSTGQAFGTSDFTVEFWMYSTAASHNIFVPSSWTNAWGVVTYLNVVYWQFNGGNAQSGGSVVLNMWSHFAISRISGVTKGYLNGTQIFTAADTNNYSGTPTLAVGPTNGGSAGQYISEVRITKGIALYTSNFVPPTQTLTNYSTTYPSSLLLNFTNGGIIDQHSSFVLESVGNTQLSTAVKKYNAGSIYFDGTGDYLTIASNNMLAMGRGDFTVECWIYPQTTVQFTAVFLTSTFQFFVYNSALYWNDGSQTSGGTITSNTWQHIAVTRSGTSLRGFINGTQVITTTSSVNLTQGTNYIGYNGGTAGQGYIDDLRITKGYARYTSNFTAPTSALITK